MGYHLDPLFSVNYSLSDIINAVGPDLLHQVSKFFMDYLLKQWIFPLVKLHWKSKKGINTTIMDIKTEIDSRFAMMPAYPGLRQFANSIFTQNHHWTIHEYKAMMKVVLGVFIGLCPPEGIQLICEYLHIHRLSHYPIHSETSLG